MYAFDPNFDTRNPRRLAPAPWGVTPDGDLIYEFEQLPCQPPLELVVMSAECIQINGWTFPYQTMTKGCLIWLKETFHHWNKLDPGVNHKEWMNGLVDTFVARYKGHF